MRIIGGEFKGRRFTPPAKHWPTRPTTDYAKEGLFNILQNHFDFENLRVLDIFGGTGSHSYEFISRGCRDVTYVDKFAGCIQFVKKTAETLRIEDVIRIVRMDVFKYLRSSHQRFNYIFAGPPYNLPGLDTIPDLIFNNKLLDADGWLVLEHDVNNSFQNHPRFFQERSYGKAIFSFFINKEEPLVES